MRPAGLRAGIISFKLHYAIAQSNSIATDRRLCISRSKILTGKCSKNLDGENTWLGNISRDLQESLQTMRTRSRCLMLDEPHHHHIHYYVDRWLCLTSLSLSLSLLPHLSTDGITVAFRISCIVLRSRFTLVGIESNQQHDGCWFDRRCALPLPVPLSPPSCCE